MKLSDKMAKALNKQVNEEISSAYIYASMASDFAAKNLNGFASWMEKQSQEELKHAAKIKSFLYERNSRIYLGALKAPQTEWTDPKAVMDEALKHEQYISGCILDLAETAKQEKDLPTEIFLHWFVTEQLEEEAGVQSVLDKLAMIGGNPIGLYNLDREMGLRA